MLELFPAVESPTGMEGCETGWGGVGGLGGVGWGGVGTGPRGAFGTAAWPHKALVLGESGDSGCFCSMAGGLRPHMPWMVSACEVYGRLGGD